MLFRRLVLLLAGLGASLSATAAMPAVLTTIKPVQLIAAAVLDGVDAPAVLLPPGASPHSYALRPSDRRAVLQAERIYWVGPDLERFVERLLGESQTAVELMAIPHLTVREMRQTHAEVHDHLEGSPIHHHEHGHEHKPGSLDAHIWLDPQNALTIARYIAEDLKTLYPGQADRLAANLGDFEARLERLDARLGDRFEPLKNKPYFVFHDGYGYFEGHYQIAPRGVFSLSHEVQPGARHINALREQLQQAGPACVFSEPQFTPRLIDSLTRDLPVRKAELDPLGSEIPVDAGGYEALLEGLADQLAGCLEQL